MAGPQPLHRGTGEEWVGAGLEKNQWRNDFVREKAQQRMRVRAGKVPPLPAKSCPHRPAPPHTRSVNPAPLLHLLPPVRAHARRQGGLRQQRAHVRHGAVEVPSGVEEAGLRAREGRGLGAGMRRV